MVKSLPQFTINRFISCLTSIGQQNGKIHAKSFQILDGKGNDLRRLFTQLEIIENPKKTGDFLKWTSDGEKLYNLKDDIGLFGNYLHHILMGRIPQYKVMVDLFSKYHSDYFKKKDLLIMLKKEVSRNGWNLPEPTFNGLILLARTTSLVELDNGKYLLYKKTTSDNIASIFIECGNRIFEEEDIDLVSTEKILICFIKQRNREDLFLTIKLAFDLLCRNINDTNLEFEFGVGTDNVPGTHALLKKKGELNVRR